MRRTSHSITLHVRHTPDACASQLLYMYVTLQIYVRHGYSTCTSHYRYMSVTVTLHVRHTPDICASQLIYMYVIICASQLLYMYITLQIYVRHSYTTCTSHCTYMCVTVTLLVRHTCWSCEDIRQCVTTADTVGISNTRYRNSENQIHFTATFCGRQCPCIM